MSVDSNLLRLHQARGRLRIGQGRVARRNARRAFAAALTATRVALEKEFPRALTPKVDPIDKAADTLAWWQFEDDAIKHVSRRWDKDLAREFVEYVLAPLGPPDLPVILDLHSDCPRGCVAYRAGTDRERWIKLFHEIAHLGVRGHKRAFVRELAHVYMLWREFLSGRRRERQGDVLVPAVGVDQPHGAGQAVPDVSGDPMVRQELLGRLVRVLKTQLPSNVVAFGGTRPGRR